MLVQAEVSLYPLKTDTIKEAIESFIRDLEGGSLRVKSGTMSTCVTGEMQETLTAICEAFANVADCWQAVLVLKVSNACPLGDSSEGEDTDVGEPT